MRASVAGAQARAPAANAPACRDSARCVSTAATRATKTDSLRPWYASYLKCTCLLYLLRRNSNALQHFSNDESRGRKSFRPTTGILNVNGTMHTCKLPVVTADIHALLAD